RFVDIFAGPKGTARFALFWRLVATRAVPEFGASLAIRRKLCAAIVGTYLRRPARALGLPQGGSVEHDGIYVVEYVERTRHLRECRARGLFWLGAGLGFEVRVLAFVRAGLAVARHAP